jgi:hypothetical protein
MYTLYLNTVTAFTFHFLNPVFLCLELGFYSVKNVNFTPCLSCSFSLRFFRPCFLLKVFVMLVCLCCPFFWLKFD